MFNGDFSDLLQSLPCKDASGGVMRRAEDEELCLRGY